MSILAPRIGGDISAKGKERLASAKTYPTLDTWRNPLTRRIARHFANAEWEKTLSQIDFDFRMNDTFRGEIACMRYETRATRPERALLLYVHGGGFVAGSPKTHAATILPVCELSGCEAIGVDYTLTPEARFPVAVDEINQVYRALISQRNAPDIILVSDSTGCALALANLLRWRDEGVSLPVGAVFISPCIDGKAASDTHITLDRHDPLFKTNAGKSQQGLFKYYAPGCDLTDPAVSPLYGNFEGLPPILIHVGSREVLLGEAARLSEAARQGGGDTMLRVFDGMFHMFHMHWQIEEAKAAHEDIADFIISATSR